MALTKNTRRFLLPVLSAVTVFILAAGCLPTSPNSEQRAIHPSDELHEHHDLPLSHHHQGHESNLNSISRNLQNPQIQMLQTTSSEGVAIVDWKSYVEASRYNFALNNWSSLKDDPDMVKIYGKNGPVLEGMPMVLCLVDSSPLEGDGQSIEMEGCTWDEVHDPRPSQRWRIRYKYLGNGKKGSGGFPKWIANIQNSRTERCLKATYDANVIPDETHENPNTAAFFKAGKIVSSQCRAHNKSKKGLQFTIQSCINSQATPGGTDEIEDIFRNWSLCIYPSHRRLLDAKAEEDSAQKICSNDKGSKENIVLGPDRRGEVGWGCGSNTWYFPTQALSTGKGETEWQWL
ncbi:hypothetical protein TWF281_010977 [Arthrobotrys megalospora]